MNTGKVTSTMPVSALLHLLNPKMNPDALIKIRFLTTKEGGRKLPILGNFYGCPVLVDDKAFDCRFLSLNSNSEFELGLTYNVAVKFINPELALKVIKEGAAISLWEGKIIALGSVTTIYREF
jgi:hypothetical protein